MVTQVFFTDALGAGGISTNVVALASYVGTSGEQPIVVPLSSRRYGSGVWEFCSKFAEISTVWNFLYLLMISRRHSYVFFVNSARTLLIAYLVFFLSAFKGHGIKIVFCVYHPSEFSAKGYWCSIYRRLVFSLGPHNIFFMNGACYAQHAAACPVGSVIPNFLTLAIPKLSGNNLKTMVTEKRSVLTVGRFVGFKMHYMRALLQYAMVRPDFDFLLAGYGKGESELKAFVLDNDLTNVVFLGNIEYSKLTALYESASCYVGMGTTLVEAASAGTPCVVAVVGVPGDVCYGLFVGQTEYDMGEFRAEKPMHSMTKCLDYVLSLGENDFNSLSGRHREFSKQFGIDVVGPLYLQLCQSSKSTSRELKSLAIWVGFIFATSFFYVIWRLRGKGSRYDVPYMQADINSAT